MHRRSLPVLLLLVVSLSAGCAPAPEPEPDASASFASDDEAFAAAEATYRAYIDALNEVDLADPATFDPVYRWLAGEALANEKKSLTALHADKIRVDGTTRLTLIRLTTEDPQRAESVELDACIDVSAVTLINEDGVSIVSPDRPDVQSMSIALAHSDISSTHWLVTRITGRDGGVACS